MTASGQGRSLSAVQCGDSVLVFSCPPPAPQDNGSWSGEFHVVDGPNYMGDLNGVPLDIGGVGTGTITNNPPLAVGCAVGAVPPQQHVVATGTSWTDSPRSEVINY